ncbi:prepilin-type N-terminal cleavage/methylation domain-containing protein [Romboutsia sp. Marseille-P6047]|uniref:prepilin-type N-terminal cleavage/methylation domain-containing protein n=1 Tax=Romboutsia sp. Marseille-P6047 TaxID=2161817 RepID=UPI000F0705B0|nr:prepilin-type N-terminal cleavage/methylation domain-containing protein [Romboutsia sp. Marseille-P6047]
MVNLKKFRSKKKKGFTLIEMVMVVVILGILSSMAMMKYGEVQKNAKIKSDCATAITIAKNDGKISSSESSGVIDDLVKNGYLQSKVQSNSTNKDFDILIKGDSITISSIGDDGTIQFYPKLELPSKPNNQPEN